MSPGEQDRTVLPRRCPTCGEHFPLDYKVCPRHAVELVGVDSQTDDPYIGSTLAEKYRIEAVIGDGGMGRVYEAKHVRMPGRTVAVKILHRVLASDAEVVSRFRREAEIAGTIVHPNVVQIHDVDQTIDGTPFIVCERLVGEDLGQHLDRVGRIGVRETVHILRQAAAVLMVAHSRGVIHRDLKPTNLFLVGDPASPTVKLIDFGIAKLHDPKASQTQTGMIMGTPAYMAPEQARGSKVDGRADLYALGAIAYRCVTGRPPFDIDDAAAALHAVLTSEPPRPRAILRELPEAFEMVLQRAMAREPAQRYADLEEFDAALAGFVAPTSPTEAVALRASTSLAARTATDIDELSAVARRARPEIAAYSGIGAALLIGGLADVLALIFSASSLAGGLAVAAAFGVLATPGYLYVRYLQREVWSNSPRAVAWARSLAAMVSAAGMVYAASFLCLRLLDLSLGSGDGPGGWGRIPPWVLALGAAVAVWRLRQQARSTREEALLSISVF
ncbi:serine/threonine-protein kinase [Nannocystis pusilla]|uniref:serine/threonine-protein kinase n=1 Tax=Nannocystis pusilla TaxID=889268 RepID=UPI003DA1D20F